MEKPGSDCYLNSEKYRSDIDGLRAIAVLLVVAYHAFPTTIRGGFIGVDIFFIISGFLISSLIFEKIRQGNFSFIDFYARRIKRIFPSLIVVLIVCLIAGWFSLLHDEFKQLGKHVTGATEFISNFLLWKESGYFDNSAETKPLLHLWSLGIEEQFYFIWPLLLWITWRSNFNWLMVCILVAVTSFVLNIKMIHSHAIATFYSPQTRFWELVIGSSLAYLTLYKRSELCQSRYKFIDRFFLAKDKQLAKPGVYFWCNIQSILGVVFIISGVLLITKDNYFPGFWALFPVFGATLVISSGSQAWINRNILSSRVLVWFGLISFPLYLWHYPILSFARIIAGNSLPQLVRIVAVLISIILAWLTYCLIEKPIRFGQFNKTKIIVLFLLMAVVGFFGFLIDKNNGYENRPIAKKALGFVYESNPLGYSSCHDKSLTDLLHGEKLEQCLIESKADSIILGDSHAEDKFFGIVKNDVSKHWMLISNSSCPPTYGVNVEVGQFKGCAEKFSAILNWLIDKPEIKTVALSYYGNYFLTTDYAADHLKNNIGPKTFKISSLDANQSRTEMFEQGLDNTIKRLQQAKKQVIIFIDVPELPFFPKDCYRNPYNKCSLTRKEVDLRQQELRSMIAKLQNNNPGLLVFDPIKLYCKNELCRFFDKNKILYRDSHHLSLKGSEAYGKYYVDWQKKILEV